MIKIKPKIIVKVVRMEGKEKILTLRKPNADDNIYIYMYKKQNMMYRANKE